MDRFDVALPPELAVEVEPFSIDDVVRVVDGEPIGGMVDRWRVEDDGGAEWAARHRAEALEVIADADSQAAEWVQRIVEWRAKVTRRAEATVRFFTPLLEDYALRAREESGGRRKTVELPSATIGTTAKRARPVVVKEDEFVAWAVEHAPELVRPKVVPAVSEFKGRVEVGSELYAWDVSLRLECGHETGWIVEGVEMPSEGDLIVPVPCRDCPDDPVLGVVERAVDGFHVEPVVRAVAVLVGEDGDGEQIVVPGLGVEPATVTAKVRQ